MATKGMAVFSHAGEDYTINDPNNANEFSASAAYKIGDQAYYQGNLYEFIKPHAAGAWAATDVKQIKLGEKVRDMRAEAQTEKGLFIDGSFITGATNRITEAISPLFCKDQEYTAGGSGSSSSDICQLENGRTYFVTTSGTLEYFSKYGVLVNGAWESTPSATEVSGEKTAVITTNGYGTLRVLVNGSASGQTVQWHTRVYDITGYTNTSYLEKIFSAGKYDYERIKDLEYGILIAHNDGLLPSEAFVRAGLVDGQIRTGTNYRISSKTKFRFPYAISISADNYWKFGVHTFDENGDFEEDSGWIVSPEQYSVPRNKTFRICIAKKTENPSETADIDVFASKIHVAVSEDEKENVYFGEKVVIGNNNPETHAGKITLWKDFLGSEIQNITDYALHLNQSIAIYKDYLFMFSDGGTCTILDFNTKSIIGKCSFTPSEYQHANSAMFTDIFYDADDDFPLLLLSRCGNNTAQSTNDEGLFYRITVSESVYTMTLINQIKLDYLTYGVSYGIDLNTNLLYTHTFENGGFQVTTDNPLILAVFKMPTKEEILSGNEILLTKDDIIARMEAPHYTPQSMCVDGGIIYTGIAWNNYNVWAFDVWRNKIVSKIPLISTYECEGVAIKDGKIYVSQTSNTDTTGVNPCKIYELSF